MAWIDDRAWCHPKLTDLSDRAFRVWVNGLAYSSGFGTRGLLTVGHQRTIGSSARVRKDLVATGLWDEADNGAVVIHEWEEKNGRRDDRRERDRQRKRDERKSKGTAGQSTGRGSGTSPVAARGEGSEGSEGTSKGSGLPRPPGRKRLPMNEDREVNVVRLLAFIGAAGDPGTEGVVRSYGDRLSPAALAKVTYSVVNGNTRKNRASHAVGALKKELEEAA